MVESTKVQATGEEKVIGEEKKEKTEEEKKKEEEDEGPLKDANGRVSYLSNKFETSMINI